MYHEVTDDPTSSGFQRPSALPYTISRQSFGCHLDEIAAGPLVPELVTETDFNESGSHLFLTFDDGGRSALYVADELSSQGWKGHFFIVTRRIGQNTFIDVPGIRYLRSCGHLVGSHSHTHPDIFRALPAEQMREEWRVSCDIIATMLGEPCVAASVPGGDISPTVFRIGAEAGLRYLFTSDPWMQARRVGSCWIIGRHCVKANISPAAVRELVEKRGWRRAQLERWLKDLARRGLGSLYAAYVRRTTRTWSPGGDHPGPQPATPVSRERGKR